MTTRLAWENPAGTRPEGGANHVFKAGSWSGGELLLCTETTVLVLDAQLELQRVISHPWFNDVHHVARVGERLHVVSTGLDALLVLGADDDPVEVVGALDQDVWERFDPRVDYRLVPSTKPHASHPNYVAETPDGRWLTRAKQHDAVLLGDRSRTLPLGDSIVHDGHVDGDRIWYTGVNGRVVLASWREGRVLREWDLNELDDRPGPLGWCRGIHPHGGLVYVGFSHLRRTRFRQNVAWVKDRLSASSRQARSTRIVAYDLRGSGEKVAEWDLEAGGMGAVFSILPPHND